MRNFLIAILAIMSIFFAACEQDQSTLTDNVSQETDYQQQIEAAEQQLEEAERLVFQDQFAGQRQIVTVPAGSVNALQAAIDKAGPHGIVKLESGVHTEDETVFVNHPVRINGEEGAIIESQYPSTNVFHITVNPVIRIEDANFVHVTGIQFVPANDANQGNVGILVFNSDYAFISGNNFDSYQMAVVVDNSDYVIVKENVAEGLFSEGFNQFNCIGIFNIGDNFARTRDNQMHDFGVSYFASGSNGIYYSNEADGGTSGIIYCTAVNFAFLPDGTPISASESSNNWLGIFNLAKNNSIGHLVIDGSNNCTLINNEAVNCSLYDVELAGTTLRFGTPEPLPTTFNNLFIAGSSPDIEVKDCGDNNTIIGGQLVDTVEDPCF